MWASFLTLVASGVGFAVRAAMGGIWEAEFNIGGPQFGAIMGAGFLGFGMMIFFGGILTEKFGYKSLLFVAFILHLASAAMIFAARPSYAGLVETDPAAATKAAFNMLFWSTFLFSIAQGLYEAVINPMIAQLYPENQTHYLNILHAGWPAGMIVGGVMAACLIGNDAWVTNVAYWEIVLAGFAAVVVAYGALAFTCPFPKTIAAKSKGNFGVLFSCFASPVFLLLILIHACIGYVELGVDSWVTKLMNNLMPNAILILIYTSFLMFILRFFAGPIVHKINPIGLLFVSSILACLGLLWLGSDIESVAVIFAAATLYSLGKAFFWPTMLGVAGERFPQSGAIAMGALGAAGMLTVGLVAGSAIGYKQASNASGYLAENSNATFERYAEKEETGLQIGVPDLKIPVPVKKYRQLTPNFTNAANAVSKNKEGELDLSSFDKLRDSLPETSEDPEAKTKSDVDSYLKTIETDYEAIQKADLWGGRRALTLTAAVPAAMAVGFLVLLIYFASTGGYKRLVVDEDGNVVEDKSH
jgi:MFS family permease